MEDFQDLHGEPDLRLGGLSIWAVARQFPDASDFWDGNWITTAAEVVAPGARVQVRGSWLRSDEVGRFLGELEVLRRDLKGTAELLCLEPTLNAKLTCDIRGHVEIEFTPDHIDQAHRFTFHSDQTFLAEIIAGCRRLLAKHPVRVPLQT